MCGIAGLINGTINEGKMQKSFASMTHRGPDGKGIFKDDKLTLLHTRLSIQDLSEQASQPMFSADNRFIIIFNGEVYNHPEIRKKLEEQGYKFHSTSDTETLLYGFLHYGKEILQMINGIFAFAIYDKQKRRLFIARDSFGVKPLYYYHEHEIFIFASEIKTIIELATFDKKLNADALFQTLMLQWQLGTNTGFQKIKKLLPGHFIEIEIDKVNELQIEKWFEENFNGVYNNQSEETWINKLDEALNNAVRSQLLSDKPIGYFLSGGLDSSLLLAIAHKIDPAKVRQAFTIDAGTSFQKEGFSADVPFAKIVAKHLDIELEIIKASTNFLQEMDKMIYQLDEAQADIAPLFVQQISKVAKAKGFDVLIGGVGGDDVFSGYRRHQALYFETEIVKTPLLLRKIAKQIVSFLPNNNRTRRIKKAFQNIDQTSFQRLVGYFFWNEKEIISSLFTEEYLAQIDTNSIENFFIKSLNEIPNEKNPLNQILHFELNSFLPCHNLNYTDKMGMAEGVEIRVPFLDKELVTLAAKMPPELKMKGKTTKYLLRKVAERYLPKEIIYRPKTGFGAPIRSWIQEDKLFQNEVWERLNRPCFINRKIFSPTAVEQLFQDTIRKKRDNSYTLLSLLAIESWLRQFAD